MKRLATTLFSLALLGSLGVGDLFAQTDVTVRQIHEIAQPQIDALNAAGAALTGADFGTNVTVMLNGETVKFTGVVMSNPRNSGLSTPNSETGLPSRVHIFVRDTSSVAMGNAGMTIQVVDGGWEGNGTLNLAVGDVITVTGTVGGFFQTIQLVPTSIELLGPYETLDLPATILDPTVVTTADINMSLGGDGTLQTNWTNLPDLRNDYVKLEGATVAARDISGSNEQRPLWYVTSDDNVTATPIYALSLRYRSDRNETYNADQFNVLTDDFVPPPPGATINLSGYLSYNGSGPDYANRGVPAGAILNINPVADSDLEILESPPEASAPSRPDGLIAGDTPFTVSTTATADDARTLTGVDITYYTSADATENTLAASNSSGDTWEAEIPGMTDGTFVIYYATATDNTGASRDSDVTEVRVLGAITDISHIQESFLYGESPFSGQTLDMDLEVTIQTDPANAGTGSNDLVAAQDGKGPWSGIGLRNSGDPLAGMAPGDVIKITNAEVENRFGLTRLRDYTFETVSQGGAPYTPIIILTSDVVDEDVAETLEAMYVRVEDVVVMATNADDPSGPFGEFSVSSDGTEDNAMRVDDQSTAVSYDGNDPATLVTMGERLDFVQGTLWYSFSNFKLEPGTLDDIGDVTNTAREIEELPEGFVLTQNYPNPFNPSTTIRYALPTTGKAILSVYDVTGREVARLVDREQMAGEYEVQFDARSLASGLYVYRLSAGSHTATRRMMFVK